jgi:hypothetical protein
MRNTSRLIYVSAFFYAIIGIIGVTAIVVSVYSFGLPLHFIRTKILKQA